jgi:hypothetical protein
MKTRRTSHCPSKFSKRRSSPRPIMPSTMLQIRTARGEV